MAAVDAESLRALRHSLGPRACATRTCYRATNDGGLCYHCRAVDRHCREAGCVNPCLVHVRHYPLGAVNNGLGIHTSFDYCGAHVNALLMDVLAAARGDAGVVAAARARLAALSDSERFAVSVEVAAFPRLTDALAALRWLLAEGPMTARCADLVLATLLSHADPDVGTKRDAVRLVLRGHKPMPSLVLVAARHCPLDVFADVVRGALEHGDRVDLLDGFFLAQAPFDLAALGLVPYLDAFLDERARDATFWAAVLEDCVVQGGAAMPPVVGHVLTAYWQFVRWGTVEDGGGSAVSLRRLWMVAAVRRPPCVDAAPLAS